MMNDLWRRTDDELALHTLNGLAICAGVGGLELGIKLAIPGYRTVCHVERETYSAAVLVARMADEALDAAPIWDDVTTFDGKPWRGKVDIVSSGPPCQPFSVAGKRRGTADERWIWPDIFRVVCEVRPRFVFLENVPALLRSAFGEVLGSLASVGYDAEWDVFSAAGVGAPHLRKRLFMLALDADGLRRFQPTVSRLVQKTRRRVRITSARIVAHPASLRGQEVVGKQSNGTLSGIVTDADKQGCEAVQGRATDALGAGSGTPWRGHRADVAHTHCKASKGPAESWPQCRIWCAQSGVCVLADGTSHRVDRLRAIGEGVVPAVAAKAWTVLSERIARERAQGKLPVEVG